MGIKQDLGFNHNVLLTYAKRILVVSFFLNLCIGKTLEAKKLKWQHGLVWLGNCFPLPLYYPTPCPNSCINLITKVLNASFPAASAQGCGLPGPVLTPALSQAGLAGCG